MLNTIFHWRYSVVLPIIFCAKSIVIFVRSIVLFSNPEARSIMYDMTPYVTYCIEEERQKPGKCRQRKVVHFNYLKTSFSPPESHEKPFQLTSSDHAEETAQAGHLTDARQLTRGTVADSGNVELEWLENPVTTVTEGSRPPQ